MDKKNLLTRTLAGIVYIAVLLLGIFGGKHAFMAVFGVVTAIALYEFYRMVENETTHAISKIFNIVFGVLIFFSAYLFLEDVIKYVFPATVLAYLLALFVSGIVLNRNDILQSIIFSVFGQIYITLPFSLLLLLSYHYTHTDNEYHNVLMLAIFVFIWVNDSFAYLVGSLFGKHKLIQRISPKKSVEGFVGGIIFTIAAGLIFAHFTPGYSTGFWIGYALVVSLFGTIGDLFESLIKRTFGVKDAGHIIPGHGGILDRIDSLLIVIPAIYLYLMIFMDILPFA
ncbi:MAG: phosphatidate cytidylyltransferase [Petrimonas sp.]|nr:phosphatidate cytidylyltransferase [Petrimonas sp.]